MSTPRYRYLFCDLRTDAEIVSLELTGVSFDRRIIQAGSFRAKADVPNAAVAAKVRRIAPSSPEEISTGPGRTVVHVYRDDQIWGTYLIWSVTPSADARGRITVDIQGASLESYLSRVEIREDVDYPATDQLNLATNLISDMQQPFGGDTDILLGWLTDASGVFQDHTYLRSEAATYGQRLTELANQDPGFEWMIRTYADPDGTRHRLFVAQTQLGDQSAEHRFTRPGNILTWSYASDATGAATSYQARGATIQTDLGVLAEPLMSYIHPAGPLLAAGWPRLDRTVDYQGETSIDKLFTAVKWWADNRAGATRIPQVTVRLDGSAWTPNMLGDYATVTIVDDWFPIRDGAPTFSHRWRIVGAEITPPTRTEPELVKFVFAEGAA